MPVQPRTLSPAPLFNTFSFPVSLSSFCASVSCHLFSVCLSRCPGCCLSIFLCGSSPHLSVSSHTPFLSSLFSCLSLSSLPPSLWNVFLPSFPLPGLILDHTFPRRPGADTGAQTPLACLFSMTLSYVCSPNRRAPGRGLRQHQHV